MSQVKILEGNLLEASDDIIAHQCNCVTSIGKGLAKAIFDRFPYSNVYTISPRIQGECLLTYPPDENKDSREPIIAGLLGQYYPGGPKSNDTSKMRLMWFEESFESLCVFAATEKLSIALPYKIGCGLAQGKWEEYLKVIQRIAQKYQVRVNIYQQDM